MKPPHRKREMLHHRSARPRNDRPAPARHHDSHPPPDAQARHARSHQGTRRSLAHRSGRPEQRPSR
ncbi:hypothetical protein GSUB_06960 [Geoalkalibacter subterraneus]|uniref:Uncharacterized protein n=1 Tax=Geoalkalibacter subterraneus TaxID=483547 RepID=A0A0B5FNV1_9BACT|nr:hypothetical protein GSUB_06960 [Geoalkalibacter subterraneus]